MIQTLNISLPTELVKKADQTAKSQFRSRSELIKEALRAYLEDAEVWNRIFSFGQSQRRKLKIKTEVEVNRLVREYRHGS